MAPIFATSISEWFATSSRSVHSAIRVSWYPNTFCIVPAHATRMLGPSHHSDHTVAPTNVATPTANARHFLRGNSRISSTIGNSFIAAASPHSTAAASSWPRRKASTPSAVNIHKTISTFPWCTSRSIGNEISARLSGIATAVMGPIPARTNPRPTHPTSAASHAPDTPRNTTSGTRNAYIGAITAAANGGYATGENIGYGHGLPATLKKIHWHRRPERNGQARCGGQVGCQRRRVGERAAVDEVDQIVGLGSHVDRRIVRADDARDGGRGRTRELDVRDGARSTGGWYVGRQNAARAGVGDNREG